MTKTPKKSKYLVLEHYQLDMQKAIESMIIVERETAKPTSGQVLIKIESAAVNPSDLTFIQGIYGIKKAVPTVPGFEGSGIVVSAGEDTVSQSFIGKRVAFAANNDGDGSWAEYIVTNTKSCIPIMVDLPKEQAAGMIVNPYTAVGLMEQAEAHGSKAIILSAAASQLAGMVRSLAKDKGITVINVVRREEQVAQLKAAGEMYIFNSNANGFASKLRKLAKKLEATSFFDAVSGELTGLILSAMPEMSQAVVYGALTGENISNVAARDIIFMQKSIQGFILGKWIASAGIEKMQQASMLLQTAFAKGQMTAEIQKTVTLEDAKSGILQYAQNMSDGKVVILP